MAASRRVGKRRSSGSFEWFSRVTGQAASGKHKRGTNVAKLTVDPPLSLKLNPYVNIMFGLNVQFVCLMVSLLMFFHGYRAGVEAIPSHRRRDHFQTAPVGHRVTSLVFFLPLLKNIVKAKQQT